METTDVLQQQLKVHCPKHNSTFYTSAQREILCEIYGETLAHDFPYGELWEYCCLCETHWPSSLNRENKLSSQCPRCDREITRRFYCHQCQTLTHDSDEATRGKSYRINVNGVVEPACPSCLSPVANALLHAHHCEEISGSFTTAREVCPLCKEKVVKPVASTTGPTASGGQLAPVAVGDFVRQVPYRATIAKLDYSTGVLMSDSQGDGPFLVIPCGQNTDYSYLIPRYERFKTQGEFEIYYSKFYDCQHPNAGDILIRKPAIVTQKENGWFLLEKGELDVKGEMPPLIPKGEVVFCAYCGAKGNSRQKTCKTCGKARSTAIPPPDSLNKCPKCNQPVRAESQFCGSCGNDLRVPEVAPEKQESEVQKPSSIGAGKVLVGLGVLFVAVVICGLLIADKQRTSNSNNTSFNSSTTNGTDYNAGPSPTPNPVGRTGSLTINVNVRDCAAKNCKIIAEHFQGARVKVLEVYQKDFGASDWYRVEVLSYGRHTNNSDWQGKKLPKVKEDRDRAYEVPGDEEAADTGWIISEKANGEPIVDFE